jgi:hypothetical protein
MKADKTKNKKNNKDFAINTNLESSVTWYTEFSRRVNMKITSNRSVGVQIYWHIYLPFFMEYANQSILVSLPLET